jgi:6-phosphogluconolactonase
MFQKSIVVSAISVLVLAACGGSDGSNSNGGPVAHVVAPQLFAQTDDSTNAVLHFTRNTDGTLGSGVSIATGGKGTGGVTFANNGTIGQDSLTSNNSVAVSADSTRLFVTNAGDNSVSVFSIDPTGGNPTLLAVSSTGGVLPTSLAFANGVLYVTHQQGQNQLGAYRLGSDGKLTQIGAYATIQANTLPTQVTVTPDGKFVIVDIRSQGDTASGAPNSTQLAYPVNSDGTLGTGTSSPTLGKGPFSTRFGSGALARVGITVEAIGDAMSSYQLADTGTFSALSGPVTVPGQGAPCWLTLTPDNKFAYVGNGAGFISLFSVDATGHLALLNGSAASEPPLTPSVSSFAEDAWISPDGKFLYQDYAGDDKIVAYSIGETGSLTKLGEQPARTISKVSLQGLAGT